VTLGKSDRLSVQEANAPSASSDSFAKVLFVTVVAKARQWSVANGAQRTPYGYVRCTKSTAHACEVRNKPKFGIGHQVLDNSLMLMQDSSGRLAN
jgi:hypothetical protein